MFKMQDIIVLVIFVGTVSLDGSSFEPLEASSQSLRWDQIVPHESYSLGRSPRRTRFSLYREFIEPLPGVLNDIIPARLEDRPIIKIPSGLLQGTVKKSRDGRKYFSFRGIPYAEKPINDLRFEPPQKLISAWSGVRDGSKYGPFCFHLDAFTSGRLRGQEDCLYANVYTPNLDEELPVMVYIHGGGFTYGSGDFYQPKYFMDEDIVLVTFNYRLTALGFLNTGDGLILGNMGLKDQHLMLEWVQENILYFGGNPSQVTIFGESAGSASLGFHILSPKSQGLFHRAIAQSGVVLSPWALSKNVARSAKKLAKAAGCSTENSKSMVRCLKNVTVYDIAKGYQEMLKISNPAFYFVPSVETVNTEDTLISEDPLKSLESGSFNKIPLMLGVNSKEGLLYLSRILINKRMKENFNREWNNYIPDLLYYDPNNLTLSDLIRSYYFPNEAIDLNNKDHVANLTDLFSDSQFFYPTHQTAKLYAAHAPVYLYQNNYQGRLSVYDILGKVPLLEENKGGPLFAELVLGTGLISDVLRYGLTNRRPSELGVCHGDATLLLFNIRFTPGIGPLSQDYEMSKLLVKTYTDFASSREPVMFDGIPWPVVNSRSRSPHPLYMQLGLEPDIVEEPFKERMKFWSSLY